MGYHHRGGRTEARDADVRRRLHRGQCTTRGTARPSSPRRYGPPGAPRCDGGSDRRRKALCLVPATEPFDTSTKAWSGPSTSNATSTRGTVARRSMVLVARDVGPGDPPAPPPKPAPPNTARPAQRPRHRVDRIDEVRAGDRPDHRSDIITSSRRAAGQSRTVRWEPDRDYRLDADAAPEVRAPTRAHRYARVHRSSPRPRA